MPDGSHPDTDDAEWVASLVKRAQEGEIGAFVELHDRYRHRLVSFCTTRLHDAHAAEDVAQEAFLRAWLSIGSLSGPRRFYPWLRTIASNLCADAQRRVARLDFWVTTEALELLPEGETGGPRGVDHQMIDRSLTLLSERHRRVLSMRAAGRSYEQIGESEGLSPSAVKSLVLRARRRLQHEYLCLNAAQSERSRPRVLGKRGSGYRGPERRQSASATPGLAGRDPVVVDIRVLWKMKGKGYESLRWVVLVVQRHRGVGSSQHLRVRGEDLIPVAAAFGLPITQLVERLQFEGVLLGERWASSTA